MGLLMRRRCFLFFLVIMAAGCADGAHDPPQPVADDAGVPGIEIGSDYVAARAKILDAGWVAVPAECSQTKVCWDHVELATDLESGDNCGQFMMEGKEIDVCVDVIPDGARLKSVSMVGKIGRP